MEMAHFDSLNPETDTPEVSVDRVNSDPANGCFNKSVSEIPALAEVTKRVPSEPNAQLDG